MITQVALRRQSNVFVLFLCLLARRHERVISDDMFDAISDFIITKPNLKEKLVSRSLSLSLSLSVCVCVFKSFGYVVGSDMKRFFRL